MSKTGYSISDVSKLMEVEPRVLRYWEDELSLIIPRNEQGHRVYTQEEVEKIQGIKFLKERGFQLKAIKPILPKLKEVQELPEDIRKRLCQELNAKLAELEPTGLVYHTQVRLAKKEENKNQEKQEKMEQFARQLNKYFLHMLEENNQKLVKEVAGEVTTRITKEMNYQFRQQEEHFRKLDEAIRCKQQKKRRRRWHP